MTEFDARLHRLNRILYDITRSEYDLQNLKYLHNGLGQMIKGGTFLKELMIDGMLHEYYEQYEIMDARRVFKPEYSDLNFEQFKKQYVSAYQTYHKEISIENMETFDWESEFEPSY